MDELVDEKSRLKEERGKTIGVLSILSFIAMGIWVLILLSGFSQGKLTQEELEDEMVMAVDLYEQFNLPMDESQLANQWEYMQLER